MKQLFAKLREYMEQGRECVLVTIIASSGSTPRGAGSRMLVTREGIACGTIGAEPWNTGPCRPPKRPLRRRLRTQRIYADAESGGGYRYGMRRGCDRIFSVCESAG